MKKDKLLGKIIKNYEFRGYCLSVLSLILTLFFLGYNFYIGLKYQLIWNFSITFYYLILLIMRMIILISENKGKWLNSAEIMLRRMKIFKVINGLFLIVDITLLVPITLMVLGKRIINIGMIPAIAFAAFTTYKIIMSIINFQKTKKSNNLAFHSLKTINLKEAIVSIITLQNILIMTFSNGESMIELTSYTSALLLLLLISLSVFQINKGKKEFFNIQ